MDESGETRPLMQVLDEDVPPVAFMDGHDNPIIVKGNITSELEAYDLNLFWEGCGAFEANENVRKELLQGIFGGGNTWQPNPRLMNENGGQDMLVINIGEASKKKKEGRVSKQSDGNNKTCRTCSVELSPDDINRCSRCKVATYCSRTCQKADWQDHKRECVAPP